MSDKIFGGFLLIFIIFFGYTAQAEKPLCKDGYANDVEKIGLENGNGKDYFLKPCRTMECHAAEELACAFEAMMDRDYTNIMARGSVESYYRDLPRYQAIIASVGRRHPERIPVYCDLLTSIARLDDDNSVGDIETTHHVLEMAARVTRPGNQCIDKVMMALPDTEAIRSSVRQVREHCDLKASLCRRMVMPARRAGQ